MNCKILDSEQPLLRHLFSELGSSSSGRFGDTTTLHIGDRMWSLEMIGLYSQYKDFSIQKCQLVNLLSRIDTQLLVYCMECRELH